MQPVLKMLLMKPSKLIIKIVAAFALLAVLVIGGFTVQLINFKSTPINLTEEKVFVVSPGSSLSKIAYAMQAEGLIVQPRYFSLLGRWSGHAANLKTGEYLLKPGMTPLQVLDKIVAGDVIDYSLTVVEGWRFKQMLDAIHKQNKLDHSLKGLSPEEIMAQLGHPGEHPEGRFLPETYHFTAGMSDLDFLKRAYTAMQRLLEQEWSQRDKGLPYKSPYEALIMASIVEKETGIASERPEIAGVFVRRLQKRMRLQTDPTVIYGIGESYDGNIRKRDLLRDTPYNTYTRHGLPPTPIALPGADAIRAALHPAKGDSLYFVAMGEGGNGRHYFSATLEEHINAVRKYQLKR